MTEDVLNRELDWLVEGRLKRLSELNLKEELDSMDNISMATVRDGDEVLGE